MAKATIEKRDGVTVARCDGYRAEVSQNDREGEQWLVGAWSGEDWLPFFSGKVYKTEKTAVRAAVKWVEAQAARRAEDAARPAPPETDPGPTPAWLERVYKQWETSDIAVTRGE